MKRWILLVCFGLLFLSYSLCDAAPGFVLEKVILDLKSTEEEEFQQTLNVNSYAHWEWLELDLVNKFTYPQKSDDYHNLELKFGFPKLVNGLGIDLDYDWDSRYQIISTGMDYTWKPLKGLKLQFDAEAGSKTAIVAESELYRNEWDYQKINLGYNLNDWSYKWKLDREHKVYPIKESNTYIKYSLEQEVAWDITRQLKLGLKYGEETKEYTYIDYSTKNYWKDEWTLWGRLRRGKNQRWDWKFRFLDWEKGFDPYRDNSYVTADYQWWSKQWRFDIGVSWSDLKYLTEKKMYDPDEEVTESEDYQSREEQKVSLELTRYFEDVQWGVELFSARKDYTIGTTDGQTGIITKIIWEIGKYKIRLNIAPFGNASSSKDYYQLKLEYNPKDVID